ncbi:MAG: zinc metallopeptidase, partial [Clostridia bacterium]|nr:zinc metallopeptidase [Clostridia bacterium]
MKFVKCAIAVLTAAMLALTMVGCHEAKEIVASYDDIEITGGMYLAMLLEADGAARNLADEQNESDDAIEDYGDVEIKSNLSDHFDYDHKVLRLSSDVFHGETLTAAVVAARVASYAVQDKDGYSLMKFRFFLSKIITFVNSSLKMLIESMQIGIKMNYDSD